MASCASAVVAVSVRVREVRRRWHGDPSPAGCSGRKAGILPKDGKVHGNYLACVEEDGRQRCCPQIKLLEKWLHGRRVGSEVSE